MEELLNKVDSLLWGPVTIVFLVGTGIFMTGLVRGIQFRHFIYAFGLLSGKYDNPKDKGEITHFQVLSAALSATIGTRNIAGVGTAVAIGGAVKPVESSYSTSFLRGGRTPCFPAIPTTSGPSEYLHHYQRHACRERSLLRGSPCRGVRYRGRCFSLCNPIHLR